MQVTAFFFVAIALYDQDEAIMEMQENPWESLNKEFVIQLWDSYGTVYSV